MQFGFTGFAVLKGSPGRGCSAKNWLQRVAKAWDTFWYIYGDVRQQCVLDTMAQNAPAFSVFCERDNQTLPPWSLGYLSSRAPPLPAPQNVTRRGPCLPRSQRRMLHYNEEPHRDSL